MKKRNSIRCIFIILLCVLLVSSIVVMPFAAGTRSKQAMVGAPAPEKTVAAVKNDGDLFKEETVYVLAAADGSAQKVIVSDWLKNPAGAAQISDVGTLTDLKNVKGEETFSKAGDGTYVWEANGSDIYCQGTSSQTLPVSVAVSYLLDGKKLAADELAGKSGKVTMRFDYTVNEKKSVDINGKKQDLSVPFLMLTGMILDNDRFTNVQVSNGKVLNDGDRTVVMGFALPGMRENLGIDAKTLEVPSYVEVTADVKEFALTTTLTLASDELLQSADLSEVVSAEDLDASVSTLLDAATALTDGSAALYDGLETLLEKTAELTSGVNSLADGAQQIKTGAASLQQGSQTLNAGLNALASKNDALNGGAKQVFESMLALADSQLAASGLSVPKLTIENYRQTINGALDSVSDSSLSNMVYQLVLNQVSSAVNAQQSTIRTQVEQAVRAQVLEGVLEKTGMPMTAADYAQAVAAGTIPAENDAAIQAAVDAAMVEMQGTVDTMTQQKVQELIDRKMQSSEIQAQLAQGSGDAMAQAAAGKTALTALLQQLDDYNTFYQGLLSYTAGVRSAADGSAQLTAGTETLMSGATALSDGAQELQAGTKLLTDGVTALRDGAMQLSDGMQEIQEKGMEKLKEVLGDNSEDLLARIQATAELARDYRSFSGLTDGMNGTVRFIIKTDAIGE